MHMYTVLILCMYKRVQVAVLTYKVCEKFEKFVKARKLISRHVPALNNQSCWAISMDFTLNLPVWAANEFQSRIGSRSYPQGH